ncbi:MAG: hypothetical protein JWN08_990 [Frankiales bacterium]|nr:hypothetical protein [Frankiales bacterium]
MPDQLDLDAGQRLRAAVQALKSSLAPVRAAAPVSSVFGRAAAAVRADAHPPAHGAALANRFRHVETTALLPGTTLALLVAPTPEVADDLAASCRQLVAGGAVVVVLGPHLPRAVSDRSRPLTVPLRADDALSHEWGLIACGPARRVAFLARREPAGPESWQWLTTRDTVAVQRAATAILERVPFLRLRVPLLSD